MVHTFSKKKYNFDLTSCSTSSFSSPVPTITVVVIPLSSLILVFEIEKYIFQDFSGVSGVRVWGVRGYPLELKSKTERKL